LLYKNPQLIEHCRGLTMRATLCGAANVL